MKIKSYTLGPVTYTYNPKHRKWNFAVGTYTLVQSCPGGAETAHKVAAQVAATFKRKPAAEGIDGLARKAIKALTPV